ncbi:hypothetical protein A2229_02975 [Candidatus Peregrinibacteria bacterium RIFOXYA2_FULL_33_7]|nr:MAG: hypothetical protein A2229_02975 [Candidatus Peregrinibacteria bacterium RIFOXYA2_FULL_33_7]
MVVLCKIYGNMKNSIDKKEIRIKVNPKLYELLTRNASVYGVKPNDYIIHLILGDLKQEIIPYVSKDSEFMIDEGYKEVEAEKKNKTLKGLNAIEVLKKFS